GRGLVRVSLALVFHAGHGSARLRRVGGRSLVDGVVLVVLLCLGAEGGQAECQCGNGDELHVVSPPSGVAMTVEIDAPKREREGGAWPLSLPSERRLPADCV